MKNETYRPLPKSLTIKASKTEGLGLFATEDMPKNTNLGVTHIAEHALTDEIWIEFINSYIRTPLGGFFNHSESHNIQLKARGRYVLEMVTIKDIKAGEEILATYTMYDPTQ